MKFTIEVTWADEEADFGAVARALTEVVAEQEGVTHVKTYANAELVAESFSEDEFACTHCGTPITRDKAGDWSHADEAPVDSPCWRGDKGAAPTR